MGIRALLVIPVLLWAWPVQADPPPARTFAPPRYAPPPGAIAPRPSARPCQITMRTVVEPMGRRRVRIKAIAVNNSAATLSLTARDACPNGPIAFAGLPEGYDYYGTCNAGACAGPSRPPVRWTLPQGRPVTLAAVVVDPRGGSCARALPPGSYEVSFSGPPEPGVVTCGPTSARLEQPGATTTTPATTTTLPPTRAPQPRQVRCKPMPACGLACPGAFAHDANGCALCACADDPLTTTPGF